MSLTVVAVMQPYLFPYLGYFQLVHHADHFVFYDDVNYIKGGHINRNTLLTRSGPARFTLPVKNMSPNRHINEHEFVPNSRKILASLEQAYSRAPMFEKVFPLLRKVLQAEDWNVARLAGASVQAVADYLDLGTRFYFASELDYDREAAPSARLVEITRSFGGDEYCNPVGGKALYSPEQFAPHGITLRFLEPVLDAYPQGVEPFVPSLSVIDALMWCSVEQMHSLLDAYRLTNEA